MSFILGCERRIVCTKVAKNHGLRLKIELGFRVKVRVSARLVSVVAAAYRHCLPIAPMH